MSGKTDEIFTRVIKRDCRQLESRVQILNMFSSIVSIFMISVGFSAMDSLLAKIGLQGVYYGVHAIHNGIITLTTLPDVVYTITNYTSVATYPTNYLAVELCAALHLYHTVFYWRKFRVDDWLHHILMVGVALPVGAAVPAGSLLGYSLFFTTGLPGGIDYCLLFLNRNGLLSKEIQKRVNCWIQVWVRSPGCISHAALALVYFFAKSNTAFVLYGGLLVAYLNYWNGQYFMRQVVLDAGSLQLV